MTYTKEIALQLAGFEYFKQCIASGATELQAKNEMMTKEAMKTIKELALSFTK